MRRRIHITGASCSGATTLGAAVAERLSVPYFDTDDFYWYPSRPKFERKRPVKERIRRYSGLTPNPPMDGVRTAEGG